MQPIRPVHSDAIVIAICVLLAATAALCDVFPVASFETDAELGQWEISGEWMASAAHATAGNRSLHIRWPQGRGLIAGGLPEDWSEWERLKIDCYNCGPPFSVTLRVQDMDGNSISSWYHPLRSGDNVLEFVVGGLAEGIDLKRIQDAHVRVSPRRNRPVEVYLDNVRFSRAEPPEVYQPPALIAQAAAEPIAAMPVNGGFEFGLLGWEINPKLDGGLYAFGPGIQEDAHSGAASAAITCINLGRAGLVSRPVNIDTDGTATISVWAKSSMGGRIRYGLLTDEGMSLQEADIAKDWNQFRTSLQVAQGQKGQLHLYTLAPGTVYLDDVRFEALGAQQARAESLSAAAGDPDNAVSNPGFERGLEGWETWKGWEGGLYEFSLGHEDNCYRGDNAAAVACVELGRGGLFTEPLSLPAGEYVLQFAAKASAPSSIRYGAVYPGGRDMQDAEVGEQWETRSMPITSQEQGNWRVYLMSTGPATVYFDEVALTPAPKEREPEPEPESEPEPEAEKQPPEPVNVLEKSQGHTYLNGNPFLALGVFDAELSQLRGTAFNILPQCPGLDPKYIDRCAAEGIYVLPDATGIMRGHLPSRTGALARQSGASPAVIGWYICDHPEHIDYPVPADEMRLATAVLHRDDPNRLTCVAVSSWAESNMYRYADTADILMVGVPSAELPEGSDLFDIGRSIRIAHRAAQDDTPIWAIVNVDALADPNQLIAATYLALASGADGMFYRGDIDPASDLWQVICRTADELDTLEPVICSADVQPAPEPENEAIAAIVKAAPGGHYLIAANATAEAIEESAINLHTDRDVAQVLFETRALPVDEGILRDRFGPHERHVYRLVVSSR